MNKIYGILHVCVVHFSPAGLVCDYSTKPYDDVCFSNIEPTMNEPPGFTLLQEKSGCTGDAVITYALLCV